MASIVAYIEVREGTLSLSSLFAVGESRRIAQAVGATVYAFLPVGPMGPAAIDRLAEQLSAAGADRILCSSDKRLAGPVLDVTHGPVLAQMAEHLRPLLLLFPAGGTGTELGPPLAIRIGAAYVPAASIELHSVEGVSEPAAHRVLVSRWRAGRDSLRRIDVADFERPVVAVLLAGSAPTLCLGEAYTEVEMIPCPTDQGPEVRLLRQEDSRALVESCATLVCVAADTDPSDVQRLRAALPGNACLRIENDVDLSRATPETLLLLSVDHARLGVRAGAVGTLVGPMAELATALQRMRALEPGGGT